MQKNKQTERRDTKTYLIIILIKTLTFVYFFQTTVCK